MKFSRRSLTTSIAAALALSLTACGGGEDEAEALAGEPVAAVPAPDGQVWESVVSYTEKGGYLVGNPDAPIKLIEYGSLTCPGCAAFSRDAARPLMDEYVNTGRVSFEFRSFIIHGPLDLTLTRLIGCASNEAAVPLSDQIWANLGEIQNRAYSDQAALERALQLPEEQRFVAFGELTGLYDFFAARGVSEEQARTCLADFSSLEELATLSQGYANEDGITSTPTFVLNGSKLTEARWAGVEAALQRAGAR